MNTENRVSPQAPEIEEAIIGACLIEQRAIPLIADKLRPEMFYVLRHQLIYAAILAPPTPEEEALMTTPAAFPLKLLIKLASFISGILSAPICWTL